MRFRALAPFALAAVGFAAAPVLAAGAPTEPACDDHVKKPTDDAKKPPKASTDPSCDDDVKKPTDDEKPPKT